MLSSRGALSTQVLLMECAGAQPQTSQNLFLLSEAEKVWIAFAKVLKAQLIQNVATLIPKFGVLWMENRLLVTDGPLKYYQRIVKFGFLQTYMTTYDLDSIHVPSEAAKKVSVTSTTERLPLDLVTQYCGVGAQAANHILHEVFRYVGEALYNGRVLNLEFPGVMTITMKRERAVISFDEALLQELFAIDSRKWPLAIREMANIARQEQPQSRPESSGSTSSRTRSISSSRPSTQPKLLEPRPAFCSAAQSGRLFVDIVNAPSRLATKSATKSSPSQRAAPGAKLREPLKGRRATPAATLGDDQEEESVYEVLSPDRYSHHQHWDPTAPSDDVFCVDGEGDAVNEVIVDELPPTLPQQQQLLQTQTQLEHDASYDSCPPSSLATRPHSTASLRHNAVYHQPSTVRELLYGAPNSSNGSETASDAVRVGRKRFENHHNSRSNVAYLFQTGGPLS